MKSIDVLPDDVLLAIFDFCVDQDVAQGPFLRLLFAEPTKKKIEAWQLLVHVCRRWRCIVFGSPLRLNLQLLCTAKTPARDTLDVWPALPLFIRSRGNDQTESVDNIIAVLEHSDRVCQIDLKAVRSRHWEKVSAAMQEPFPELTHLKLHSSRHDETVPALPGSFLGGSAPRLQELKLDRVPFPGLPKLLLSTTYLVTLHLEIIPHSGYISPEAMVTCLSVLGSLEDLCLFFESPQSRPDPASRRPPPPTRSALPVLTYFWFKGASDYLEDLVARIDAPRLNRLYIILFNQIVFDTPQFVQFISRTPALNEPETARVAFEGSSARVNLTSGYGKLDVEISCRELDWLVSSLEQVCTSSLPPLFILENLYIYAAPYWGRHRGKNIDIENTLWLELLHPFTTVKNLYLCEDFAPRVVPALHELVGGRTTEVLPTLQSIFLENLQPSGPIQVPLQEAIEQFVAARQVTSHPITFARWDDPKQDKV